MRDDVAFQAWVHRAKSVSLSDAAALIQINLPKRGEFQGACPACGGKDRFSISPTKGVWNCRGAQGGNDALGLVMHTQGVDFIGACEMLNGEPAPHSNSGRAPEAPEKAKERREALRDDRRATEREQASSAAQKAGEDIRKATDLFNRARPIAGTLAEDYLTDWRGIPLAAFDASDLRFINDMPYWGLDAELGERKELGKFPCLLAAMRNPAGKIIGIKRTYLGADGRKLKTPDGEAAKKGLFTMTGGLIHLGPISETLALGEGIETTLAFLLLARDGYFGEWRDVTVAGADSLGNLASDTLELPDHVRRLIYLVDGDSDPRTTRARIERGAEAHRELGLEVLFACAPTHPTAFKTCGKDWNDVWSEVRSARRAA